MRQIANEIVKFLLPFIFTGYIGIITCCTHIHLVDGVPVVHSHLFKNIPGQPFHSHTHAAFQLIHAVTSYHSTTEIVFSFDFTAIPRELSVSDCMSVTSACLPTISGLIPLRGPPAYGIYDL